MSIQGNVSIKVTPEVLVSKADEVSIKIEKIASSFSELEKIMTGTESYWQGEAGEIHRKLYKDQKKNMDEIIRRLKEHPIDLRSIAQKYKIVETEAVSLAASLPGDVIE